MSTFRDFVKGLGKRAAVRLGSGLSRLFGPCAGEAVGILTYHRIAPSASGADAPTWNVPPQQFRGQLEGLLRRGYRPWPLRKILETGQGDCPLPPRTFVVTFDDGYENVYHHAWPVLRRLGVPATVFLATAYLDSDGRFPCDDWHQAGEKGVLTEVWRPLSTAQCIEMQKDGLIEMGSHTHSHAVFRGRPDALLEDLRTSAAVLEERFGVRQPTFAFPYGITGPALSEAARRAGMHCALSTEPVLVQPRSDPFTWGRFTVHEGDTAATLAPKLDGWYSLARSAWGRLGGAQLVEAAG
jgi:peptidoglycan/xylan/chitin deacetylase (PgdA/CDA1 family)